MAKKITTYSLPIIAKSELKAQLNMDADFTAVDDFLDQLIAAAGRQIELSTNRGLMGAVVEDYYDYFPRNIILSVSPLQTLTTIEIRATEGASYTTWSHASNVIVDTATMPPRIHVNDSVSLPDVDGQANCVKVTYVAGATTKTDVDVMLKQAVLYLAADMYQNRENPIKRFPSAVDKIVNLMRVTEFV